MKQPPDSTSKMKRIVTITFLILTTISLSEAQTTSPDKTWDLLLNDVKIRYAYALNFDTYLPRPKFGNNLKKLEGQEVTIKGFFLPVDVTGSVFVVSYNPMKTCFFCTGSGIETIVEINPKADQLSKFKKLKTDNYIELKGKLRLNAKDYQHLVYVLNEAELVKIIK